MRGEYYKGVPYSFFKRGKDDKELTFERIVMINVKTGEIIFQNGLQLSPQTKLSDLIQKNESIIGKQ
ncbi:MAG: hypothetical protein GY750_08790 [Lentisphaerae bacterium]|nr:hypothetical protein [Lentisphaerota bacterium]MCP4101507.1 hypothetical protein [Lentisphaerota bacterium]